MRYERYRKTGISWLPEVPDGWEIRRIKVLFSQRKERNDPIRTTNILSLTAAQGVVPVSEKIGAGGNKPKDDLTQYDLAYPGDLVLNCMNVVAGSVGVSNYFGAISPVYYALVAKRFVDVLYYNNIFQMTSFQRSLLPLGKGILMHESSTGKLNTVRLRISMNALNGVKLPFPPLKTQQEIVSLLDSKCGKIDRLVAAKEKEVALLKELKQSMIAEAVTRGVDHKSLKVPTGVFWQPRMPIGWSVKKCRHVLQKLSRPRPQNAELLVCTNKGTVNKRGDAKIGLVSDDETIYQGVAAGDLLIHGMDTWHGAIAVSEFDGMCTPVVHVCDSAENKAFVAYCFQNMARGKLFKLISNGVRQNTSDFRSWEKVARLPLVLPSRDEQDRIVAYIEARAAKIDAAVGKLEAEVAALKEYRERLVADVVTGQRKVA